MLKFLKLSNWLTGALILSMPISLIYFLGSQMAHGQVQRRYVNYTEIPEFTRLADLQAVEAEQVVMLRGQLIDPAGIDPTSAQADSPLLLYQERPLDGREVRYREEFDLVFPELMLEMDDGSIAILPGEISERTISHELRRVTADDREFTGFQAGDAVTMQGKWQPASDGRSTGSLIEVTGISGAEKGVLLAEVQAALDQVSLARNALGLVTLVSVLLLGWQIFQRRRHRLSGGGAAEEATQADESQKNHGEDQAWRTATAESVPTS